MFVCYGTTCKGKPCKNKLTLDSYCHLHMKQEIPLYTPLGENWPAPELIKMCIFKFPNFSFVELYLNQMLEMYDQSRRTDYEKRVYFLCASELIKLNVEICYDSPLTLFIKVLSENIEQYNFLKPYSEDFKKKCLVGYLDNLKHQAKKKLIMFYMIHCEGLYYDVVEHIMTFY